MTTKKTTRKKSVPHKPAAQEPVATQGPTRQSSGRPEFPEHAALFARFEEGLNKWVASKGEETLTIHIPIQWALRGKALALHIRRSRQAFWDRIRKFREAGKFPAGLVVKTYRYDDRTISITLVARANLQKKGK